MKHFTVIIICLIAALGLQAQIPGKIYQLGDTIVLDGVYAVVLNVDESGLHGTAMSAQALSEKQFNFRMKMLKWSWKNFVKQGKKTQEELDAEVALLEQRKKIPPIQLKGKQKPGKIFTVTEWLEVVPKGWRPPNKEDVDLIIDFYKNNKSFLGMRLDVQNNLSGPQQLRETFEYMCDSGIICYIDNQRKYLRSKNSFKKSFDLQDYYQGSEITVGIKDF